MEDKKVFIPTQLAALLHPIPLKILLYMVNMQGLGAFKIYASALSGILKMKEEHLKMGIQTLINNNLISISKNEEGHFVTKLNKDTFQKFFEIPVGELKNKEILPVAKDVTWDKIQVTKPVAKNDDMSTAEIKRMLLMLQAQLKEREQVEKMVQTNGTQCDDGLPW